jgi:glucose/arabinose dehydrogenase
MGRWIVVFTAVAALACGAGASGDAGAAGEDQGMALAKRWATERVLKVPESVFHDAERGVLYVASINGSPMGRDGNGFISRLSLAGEVLDLEWVGGLDAPKGMAVAGGTLYVSDIDRLVAVDIANGRVQSRLTVEGARFLNDVAVGSDGSVYVSDNQAGIVYRLREGTVDRWLDGLREPNGLLAEPGRLLVGTNGRLLAADTATGETSVVADNTDYIDGVAADGRGGYVISDFMGAVRRVGEGGEMVKILDTAKDGIQAADITVAAAQGLLLVPTFSDNRVLAYELGD